MTKGLDSAIWTIKDNADWTLPLVFTDRNGVAIDFTGSTFEMDIKAVPEQAVPDLALTSGGGGGIETTDLASGSIAIKIADEALSPGAYHADLIRVSSGVRHHLLDFSIVVLLGVTRP